MIGTVGLLMMSFLTKAESFVKPPYKGNKAKADQSEKKLSLTCRLLILEDHFSSDRSNDVIFANQGTRRAGCAEN